MNVPLAQCPCVLVSLCPCVPVFSGPVSLLSIGTAACAGKPWRRVLVSLSSSLTSFSASSLHEHVPRPVAHHASVCVTVHSITLPVSLQSSDVFQAPATNELRDGTHTLGHVGARRSASRQGDLSYLLTSSSGSPGWERRRRYCTYRVIRLAGCLLAMYYYT